MSERGPENIGFVENYLKSSVLYEKFRKAEVIGEKTPEQNNVANLKVEELLSTSFPVPYQSEGQIDNVPQYKSVVGMIEVSRNNSLTENVKKTAESALFEVGLALSQNKEVLKAATEGSEELNKILPSSLHEIQPYILSTILTDGKDDTEGQELVSELVDLFKMKKKADTIHGKAETDYREKKDIFLDKLYDKSQETTNEDVGGRIETMMGYVLELDKKTNNEVLRQPKYERRPSGKKPGEDGPEMEEFSYDMKYSRFVEMESKNKAIRWYDERPPQWYEEMNDTEKALIDLRLKLLNASANKEYLRNRDVEKLRNNIPEISGIEFDLLMREMPGFKEALSYVVKGLCETYVDDDSRLLLRFKNKRDVNKNIIEGALDDDVVKKMTHFGDYRDEVANYIKDLKIKGIKNEGWKEATSVAINFLYIGDSFESWDYFRELKPTSMISDKLRTIDHPMIKALGKWKVWKKGGDMNDEEKEQFETFSLSISPWIADRIDYEKKNFTDRLVSGDLKDLLPRTLCVSMLESTKIGDTNLATALIDENKDKGVDWILEKWKKDKMDNDLNIMQYHNDMLQGADYLLNLLRGKIPYTVGKNDDQFIAELIDSTSLIRQAPNIPLVDSNKKPLINDKTGKPLLGALKAVDKPEFFAWSLLISLGFDHTDKKPMIRYSSLKADNSNYDLKVQNLVNNIAIRSDVSLDKNMVIKLLGANSIKSAKERKAENNKERFNRSPRWF